MHGLDVLLNLGADRGNVRICPHCGRKIEQGYSFGGLNLYDFIDQRTLERLAIEELMRKLKKSLAAANHQPAEDGWTTIDIE